MKIFLATVLIESEQQGNSAYSEILGIGQKDEALFKSWIREEMESILAEWNRSNELDYVVVYPYGASSMFGEYRSVTLSITIDIQEKDI